MPQLILHVLEVSMRELQEQAPEEVAQPTLVAEFEPLNPRPRKDRIPDASHEVARMRVASVPVDEHRTRGIAQSVRIPQEDIHERFLDGREHIDAPDAPLLRLAHHAVIGGTLFVHMDELDLEIDVLGRQGDKLAPSQTG